MNARKMPLEKNRFGFAVIYDRGGRKEQRVLYIGATRAWSTRYLRGIYATRRKRRLFIFFF